ncbi:MAG: hypothetical protein R2824_05355 [Saprospiraceae bacterium]|nr:hypothetical protein [Lewinella sp.]
MTTSKRRCRLCKASFYGRADKIFCTIACKNEYHVRLRRATSYAVRETDKILHRNRSILLEIMGKNKTQKKVDRLILEKKKFRFNYLTGFYINSRGKTYHYVYDFAWMTFSDQEILIIRKH